MKFKDDALYLSAMTFLGLMTGQFDFATGDVQVVDLRDPKLKTSVKLLKVY